MPRLPFSEHFREKRYSLFDKHIRFLTSARNSHIMRFDNPKKESNLRCGQPAAGQAHCHGFTLLELIVVISLLGIMLIFTVPRFHETLFLDKTKTSSRWIIGKIQALKEAALRNQKQYSLHINLDTEQFWETDASMSAEELENAALNASLLPGGLKIADIEYPDRGKITSGQTDITFYKNGTSDKVLIHLQDGDEYVSFLVEPFLSEVIRYETYASFEN